MADRKTERRKHQRVGHKDSRNPVAASRFFLLSDPRKTLQIGQVLDMSPAGLSLLTDQNVPVGSTIQLLVEPPRPEGAEGEVTLGGAYRLLAEVRWVAAQDPDVYVHGLTLLEVSTAETRNRRGLEKIMEAYERMRGSG